MHYQKCWAFVGCENVMSHSRDKTYFSLLSCNEAKSKAYLTNCPTNFLLEGLQVCIVGPLSYSYKFDKFYVI